MPILEFTQNDELHMKLLRNAIRMEIPKEYSYPMSTLEIKKKFFDFETQMGYAISMNILSQNIGKVKWPRDWVEAFKERWLPAFMKKRWPVRYEFIDIFAIYPKAKLPDPVFKWKYSKAPGGDLPEERRGA